MRLIVLFPELGILRHGLLRPFRRKLDHLGLLVPSLHSSSNRVNPNALNAEFVLAQDGVERVEYLGTRDVKVEHVADDNLQAVVETAEVTDEGEQLAQGEGVREGSGL